MGKTACRYKKRNGKPSDLVHYDLQFRESDDMGVSKCLAKASYILDLI